MNKTQHRHIVVLFCSDRLAAALGARRIQQPAASCSVMAAHMAGVEAGTVICVMTAGENYVWPCGAPA